MGWLGNLFGGKRRRDVREIEARVREALASEGARVAWSLLESSLRGDPDPLELFHLAGHVLRVGGEHALAELFDRAADAPHDPQRLFELGSDLLRADQPEAAAAMLTRSLAFAPFDAVVRSELALAQARAGRPRDVMETLALHPCLADDPGALFQFGWAALLAGDLDAAEGALAELRTAPALRSKLRDALLRARSISASTPLDARDFYFIEHGGLVLDASGPLGGRHDALSIDAARGAAILRDLGWVLRERVPAPRRVVAIDDAHRALVSAVARVAEGSVIAPGKGRVPAAIVPLSSGDAIRDLPRESLEAEGAILFALTVDFTRSLPRAPDIVGAFARTVTLSPDALTAGQLGVDPALRAFVEARRDQLSPAGARTAYVADEPLPR